MAILMRHSEEGETPERRAGSQMKGLLLKVNAGVGLENDLSDSGDNNVSFRACPHLFLREGSSHPVNPFPSC